VRRSDFESFGLKFKTAMTVMPSPLVGEQIFDSLVVDGVCSARHFISNFLQRRCSQQAKHLAAFAFDLGLVASSGPFRLRESMRMFVHTKIGTQRSLTFRIRGRAGFTFGTTIWAKNI
jgi:hypothetical protein